MSRKRFTPEQIIGKLREAEVALAQGQTAAQVCRSLGIAEQTFYRWRREYGGLKVEQAKRLKALEQENARLRRAVAAVIQHGQAPQCSGLSDTCTRGHTADSQGSWLRSAPPGSLA